MELILIKICFGIILSFITEICKNPFCMKYGITPRIVVFALCFIAAAGVFFFNHFLSVDTVKYLLETLAVIWGSCSIFYNYVIKTISISDSK